MPDIKKWLDASEGTRAVTPVRQRAMKEEIREDEPQEERPGSSGLGDSGVWYYKIEPGGGAVYAGVWVNVESGPVHIRVFCS